MTTIEREALKAELMAELRKEMERKTRNKTTYQRAMEPLKDELFTFDYTRRSSFYSVDGKPCESSRDIRCDHIIRTGIAGLLRAVYKVDVVAKLPSEYEKEIRQFIGAVLLLMKHYREDFEKGAN